MSHTARFNHELAVIVLRMRQTVDVAELEASLDEVVRLPGFRKGLCLVVDFRTCETALSAADIRRLAEYAEKTDARWGATKWLIIASDDATYGLSRMFVALSERHEVTTKVFRSLAEADDWLTLGVEVNEILLRTPE
jgi:hypothetical protein